VDEWTGVQADGHWVADGIAVGAATLFDNEARSGSRLADGTDSLGYVRRVSPSVHPPRALCAHRRESRETAQLTHTER
jgi:hypothetical protein